MTSRHPDNQIFWSVILFMWFFFHWDNQYETKRLYIQVFLLSNFFSFEKMHIFFRVSEYLMGDLDSNISLASSVCSKTKSCENIPSDAENGVAILTEQGTGTTGTSKSESVTSVVSGASSSSTATDHLYQQQQHHLTGMQMDAVLLQLEQGVEVALHRAKLWSKYAKDIMTYVEKRCNLEIEFAKNVAKLAQTMRSALKEEVRDRVSYRNDFFLFCIHNQWIALYEQLTTTVH